MKFDYERDGRRYIPSGAKCLKCGVDGEYLVAIKEDNAWKNIFTTKVSCPKCKMVICP